ncbi:amidohydrolase family protein [Desulfosporosinus sp. OT]|uniref:amidohydrolase family protein n=1 Tax=Desulfosporosinus sp. OT TaxID=913865 RepID=UPI000223A84D|nr:amidohydrolase family protein [Desulfosporosinus sp. OT]EGW41942.1 amidohydrolase family protein [Desulfosporosinus sp. OT]
MNHNVTTDQTTAITNAKIFDGERVIDNQTVVIKGALIHAVGGAVPAGATVIDGRGKTLIPGLIDSHVHTDMDGLHDALKFGITTELEMQGRWSSKQRKEISERNDIADLRSPGMGVTPKGGHPSEYISSSSSLLIRLFCRLPFVFRSVRTPDEAVKFVDDQIAGGADYIKIFIEDGSCIGFPGLPVLDDKTLYAAVNEAHRRDKLTIVHVTTAEATKRATDAGVDGLGHLFFDRLPIPSLISDIALSGAFIIPTLVTLSTAFGNSAAWLAADERVCSRLSKKWLDSLSRSMNVYPQGKLKDAYATIRALRDSGVDILAGSDVSEPIPILGGLAHGASLHHELRLLVAAGLTPIEALRAATSTPARRFGLTDRGRIVPGALADLLLVDGDPLTNIADTLSIRGVWHRGEQLAS